MYVTECDSFGEFKLMHLAVSGGKKEIAILLLEHGADANVKNKVRTRLNGRKYLMAISTDLL
jgi:ankyrin repeat protein